MESTIIDLVGIYHARVQPKRCQNGCQTQFGPNFYWKEGSKINTHGSADFLDKGVLFVSNNRGFTLRYLKYHAALLFRGGISAAAVHWCFENTFRHECDNMEGYAKDIVCDFRKLHASAIMYFLTVQELEPLGRHLNIVIGEELTEASLDAYDRYLHKWVFPPSNPHLIKELCGDGHEKVLTKCSGAPMKRAGRPRTVHRVKSYTNGWFMLICPADGRIVGVNQMLHPENNNIVTETLTKILPEYPKADCFIYDRNCAYERSARANPLLKQLKYFAVDKWHGSHHTSACPCRPQSVRRLGRRVKGVNTAICEQTFSWFRTYARVLNEMRPLRNRFLVLYFCKEHNQALSSKTSVPLHVNNGPLKTPRKRPAGAYSCSPPLKRPACARGASK